jgi:hypothetical protein
MAELPDISVINNILQSLFAETTVCRNHTRFTPAPQNDLTENEGPGASFMPAPGLI